MASSTALLPAALDTAAAGPLRSMLLDRIERGEPVLLDGGEVTRAGLACLQVLASASHMAATRGLDFRIDHGSNALIRMIGLARLDAALGVGA